MAFNETGQISQDAQEPPLDSSEKDKKMQNLKRPYSDDEKCNSSSMPSAKKPALMISNPEKNALSLIHELYKNLEFKIVGQEGPNNAPIFTVTVKVNGILFEGKGRNKKAAKHKAAEAALRSLVQFKNPHSNNLNEQYPNEFVDFTRDVMDKDINNFDASKFGGNNSVHVANGDNSVNVSLGNKVSCKSEKNPVMLLSELAPSAKYDFSFVDINGIKKFITHLTINNKRFEGSGRSKKLSKAAAARSALLRLFNISTLAETNTTFYNPASGEFRQIPPTFGEHVSKLVQEKFFQLMKNDPCHGRRKILAGFVMSKGYDPTTCQVLTVSTGTKCISGERISCNGSVINDSHAEIISRRCLCNYFYSELEKHLSPDTEKDSIFKKHGMGFQIDPQYKFHLYINSAPCGDSRMFSPHDEILIDKHPNRMSRGQLRTKIECGEGTIPVKSAESIQTWDGVLTGVRLLTMSCSDKIAKWNVVGLQGALLANFIEPVYLSSIILGSLFHRSHLYRAVCGRLENHILGLPFPYRLNKPELATVLNPEVRQVSKPPIYSVNWNLGETEAEVVNAMHGRTEENQISRISKCKLFYRFLNLARKLPVIGGEKTFEKSLQMYSQCKERAIEYQKAKRLTYKAFSDANLGEWVKKPIEVDQFEWELESLEVLFAGDKTCR